MLQSSVTMHTAKGIYISLRRGRQFKAAGPLVVCAAAAAAAATPAAKGGQLHGFHRDLSKAKEVARSKEGANGIIFVERCKRHPAGCLLWSEPGNFDSELVPWVLELDVAMKIRRFVTSRDSRRGLFHLNNPKRALVAHRFHGNKVACCAITANLRSTFCK